MTNLKNSIVEKLMIASFFSLFFCFSAIGQEEALEAKVNQYLELNFKEKEFILGTEIMIEEDKEMLTNAYGVAVVQEMKKEYGSKIYHRMKDSISQLFVGRFTLTEMDSLVQFHENGAETFFMNRVERILQESMSNATQWTPNVVQDIVDKVNVEQEKKFQITLEEDCNRFREGTFLSKNDRKLGEIEIIRGEDFQMSERLDGKKNQRYKLEWVANNRFQVFFIDEEEKVHYDKKTIVNIYEVDGNRYKYISKMFFENDVYSYMEGESRIKEITN